MSHNFAMIAKTLFGFENLLADELSLMGATNIVKGSRMVSFDGDIELLYKANLSCRTAIKILKPLFSFTAINEQEVYDNINQHDWSQYFNNTQTFAIDAVVGSTLFNHSKYIALKCKDGIVDWFRTHTGDRPNVQVREPQFKFNIHINEDKVTVNLDSSGDSLHHRGYRTGTNIAPMNEVLAAGLLLQSGWQGTTNFLDPMCGSGTILIEAAMIAQNIPANILRPSFAFQKWNDYDNELFVFVKKQLNAQRTKCPFIIQGFDLSTSTIYKAKDNIENAGLSSTIAVHQQDFFKSTKRTEGPLHMLFNPPYGQRIGMADDEIFYTQIGDTLKQNYKGTTAWFISSNMEALKYVGLKASLKLLTYNGKLESRFVKYELYDGTKRTEFKNKKENQE